MSATDFPDDLVRIQLAWNATYRALSAHRARDTALLRRRLLRLSVRLWWHPFWADTAAGLPAARQELRQTVRVQETPAAAR